MIEASTVSVKTMADDTLRLTIDIEPRHAQAAFALFGVRGSPCVIARLTPEAATASARAETVAADTVSRVADDKPKGGPLARLAGQLCGQAEFREYVASVQMLCDPVGPDYAADFIRSRCDISSRAELDHSNAAERRFHAQIRTPYIEWRKARGLA